MQRQVLGWHRSAGYGKPACLPACVRCTACGAATVPGLIAQVHSALSYDALRWLRTVLHDLEERPAEALSLALRASPVTSALYAVAAAAQPHKWQTQRVLPNAPPYSEWPQLQATLKVKP
jgi:hypothetical protein